MAPRNQLKDRYRRMLDNVADAAIKSRRQPEEIIPVAVTKYASPDQVRQLIELGHQDLGESRVQQFQQRVAMANEFIARHKILSGSRKAEPPDRIRWHMVGHVQRNKVKPLLPIVRLIHSVDSLRLTEELQAQAAKADLDVDFLLQVNVAGEKQKSGLSLPAVPHVAEQIQTMFNLRLRGLMMMAPQAEDPEECRPWFSRCAELFHEMRRDGHYGKDFNLLSMGMSNDYQVAIESGANMVRIGTALFGDADPPTINCNTRQQKVTR